MKRDGGRKVMLTENMAIGHGHSVDIIALDNALEELGRIDPRKTNIVELRFFAGLTVEETAQAIDASVATAAPDFVAPTETHFEIVLRNSTTRFPHPARARSVSKLTF